MCRLCGRRAKTARDKTPVRLCRNVASELYQFFEIKVSDETNGTAYSNILCTSCNCRLNKLKNSKLPSQGLLKTMADQIKKAENLWIQFNPKVEVSDCSVCHTFAEQNKPGRHAKPLKRCRESEDQNIPGKSSAVCDSSLSSDDFKPQISSTPKKQNVKKRLLEYLSSRRDATRDDASTQNDMYSVSTAAKSKTHDAPTEKEMHILAKDPLLHSDKAVNTVSTQGEQVNFLRPLEQVQAPLTKAEEAYLTQLVRIKLKQSDDKQTVICKTKGQPIILKKIIKARKSSSLAASPLRKKRAKHLNRLRKEISGSSEVDMVAQQGTELKSTTKRKRAQILKKAGCKQLHISAKTAAQMRARMALSWAKQRKLRQLSKKAGITMACEKKERDYQESLMCGEIKIEERPLTVTDTRSDKEVVKNTPVALIENLPHFVSNLLDQYETQGMLTWHDNAIPADEIWVKIGGDHGGGSFKLVVSVVNVENPNSKENSFLVLMTEAKDTNENLRRLLGPPIKEQIADLHAMTWKEKKFVSIFVW